MFFDGSRVFRFAHLRRLGAWQLQGQICFTSLFQEQAPSCVLKFACREMTCKTREQKFCCATYFFARNHWCRQGSFAPGACCRSVLRGQAPSSCLLCVLVGVLTRERVSGACFRSKLPRLYRPLDSYDASSTTVQTNVLMNNISITKLNVLLRLLRTI